jgi:beta-galactosidase
VEVQDQNGVMVPDADQQVFFKIEGPAAIVGVDNGDPVSHESFKAPRRKAFHGKCLVVVQATDRPGVVKLTASSTGLKPATVDLTTN